MKKNLTQEQIREYYLGHLDEYFETMITRHESILAEDKIVYELAVRAFINDIAYNGLPTIRRERYNRELGAALAELGIKRP